MLVATGALSMHGVTRTITIPFRETQPAVADPHGWARKVILNVAALMVLAFAIIAVNFWHPKVELLIPATTCVLALVLGRGPEGDRRSFSVAVVAAIALSPIVWLNYLLLGLAPLALARPRLSRAWALPRLCP